MKYIDDVASLALSSALGTIGLGLLAFASLPGLRKSRDLVLAGLFAFLYALRMAFQNPMIGSSVEQSTLPHILSSLEYLVPIPGAALFADYFGESDRRPEAARVSARSSGRMELPLTRRFAPPSPAGRGRSRQHGYEMSEQSSRTIRGLSFSAPSPGGRGSAKRG